MAETEDMRETAEMVQQRLAVQAQLGSALLHLPQLQQLQLCMAPFGPVTHALAQLTSLTRLVCWQRLHGSSAGLPSVQELYCDMSWKELASLHAPQLRWLAGGVLNFGRASQSFTLLCYEDEQQLERWELLAAARGPLRWCNRLRLYMPEASPEQVTERLSSLGQAWRPDPSVLQRSNSNGSTRSVWQLEVSSLRAPLSGAALSLLPSGLTHFYIR